MAGRYTFEDPSPLTKYAATDAATELDAKIKLGAHPVYASGDDAAAKKIKDDTAKDVGAMQPETGRDARGDGLNSGCREGAGAFAARVH